MKDLFIKIKANKFATITLPLLAWTGLMIVVSSTPGKKLPEVSLWNFDKLAHGIEFFIFSFLLFRYIFLGKGVSLVNTIRIAIVIGIAYAGLDELHQIFIPNRCCAWQDFVADVSGVGIGIFLAAPYFKRKAGI